MTELLKTTNPVLISFVMALLREAGIHAFVADTHTSILEGSIGVLIPQRIRVEKDRFGEARQIVLDADLGDELEDAVRLA